MRLPVYTLIILLLAAGCGEAGSSKGSLQGSENGQQNDSTQFTNIQWQEQKLDFGKIAEGQKLEVVYHFTNTGTRPLIISKVEPGCGCTVAETPKEPIAPGNEGLIKAAFDSNGRIGSQHKSIMVYANTRGSQAHELVFTVDVSKKS
jgi:hypothetical protein